MTRIIFKELPKFIASLRAYKGHELTKAAIWMMLYTGMRQISIRRALWRDFDLEAAIWNRQPEKGDKAIHAMPLPTQAIALLLQIKPMTKADEADHLVIPSIRSATHPMSEAAIGQAIERMGYEMVGHGLRSVVSTGLNELGFKPHVIEAQQGHKKKDRIEAAYNQATYFEERIGMMQKWASYLDSLSQAP